MENTVPTKNVWRFSNSKPWVTPELKALLNEKKRAFRSGDRKELERVRRNLKYKVRSGKESFRRRMEAQLQQNNARAVWRNMNRISGHLNLPQPPASTSPPPYAVPALLHQPLSPGASGEHSEGHAFWLLQCFEHHPACTAMREWTIDYLTNRPQYVRLHDCVSEVVVCSTGAPQGTVLSPFLFSLYTSDLQVLLKPLSGTLNMHGVYVCVHTGMCVGIYVSRTKHLGSSAKSKHNSRPGNTTPTPCRKASRTSDTADDATLLPPPWHFYPEPV